MQSNDNIARSLRSELEEHLVNFPTILGDYSGGGINIPVEPFVNHLMPMIVTKLAQAFEEGRASDIFEENPYKKINP